MSTWACGCIFLLQRTADFSLGSAGLCAPEGSRRLQKGVISSLFTLNLEKLYSDESEENFRMELWVCSLWSLPQMNTP